MNDLLNQWLALNTRLSGVLACGIGYPDKSSVSQSYSDKYPPETLKNTWRCVSDTFEVASHHRIPVLQLHWIYESAQLFCLVRSDKAFLGLFVTRNPLEFDQNDLSQLMRDFLNLGSKPQ